jgi:hypothetical protein
VLDDVHPVVRHRQVVEGRQVPRDHRDVEQRVANRGAGNRARDTGDGRRPQCGAEHPPGRTEDQQRYDDHGEQEMLHHVRGEEIRVAQVVQRPVEREEEEGETDVEGRWRSAG